MLIIKTCTQRNTFFTSNFFVLARNAYYELRNCCIPELLHPHLVIYLDVPAEKVLEKIKQRNNPIESKSTAMNLDYLKLMEKHYKREYLQQVTYVAFPFSIVFIIIYIETICSEHSELMVYDWTTEGDVDIIVEDIERIDFTPSNDRLDLKFKDWVFENEEACALARSQWVYLAL